MIRLSGRKVRDGNLLCGLGGCGGRAVVVVQPLHGGVVAKVIESANPKFQEGDYVTGILDFCEYLVAPQGKGYSWEFVPASQELEIVDVSQVPPSYYLGVCGKQASKLQKTFSSLLQTHMLNGEGD
jgi:NADPH-dependent curcumin reductase CurA